MIYTRCSEVRQVALLHGCLEPLEVREQVPDLALQGAEDFHRRWQREHHVLLLQELHRGIA